jgi:hypothetical protein
MSFETMMVENIVAVHEEAAPSRQASGQGQFTRGKPKGKTKARNTARKGEDLTAIFWRSVGPHLKSLVKERKGSVPEEPATVAENVIKTLEGGLHIKDLTRHQWS